MICPKCKTDGRFATIDSRPKSWGIKRTKVCPNCKAHIATVEIYKFTKEIEESLRLSQELIDYKERERKYESL